MNQHGIDTDSFKENNVTQETVYERALFHGAAADLDQKGLATEVLEIRQRLD